MKLSLLITIVVLLSSQVSAQPLFERDTTGLHWIKTYNGKKLCGIGEYDRKGNWIFDKNDGMNGPGIIMMSSRTFDSLNRVSFEISAHSNLGFYACETEYQPLSKKEYVYKIDSIYTESDYYFAENAHSLMKEMNSKEELDTCDEVRRILSGYKRLAHLTSYNKFNKMVSEVSLDEKGDTSTYVYYEYNDRNLESHFHNEWRYKIRTAWLVWDIYSIYDDKGNKLKSFRIMDRNGEIDTSEATLYKYSKTNQLIERTQLTENKFQYRERYQYDKKGRQIREFDYREPDVLTATIINKYDKHGNVTRISSNSAPDADHPAYHYRVQREYWK